MEETAVGSKKRRLQGACDACRSRKKACDSAQRPGVKCSNCVAFNVDCTHLAAHSRKNGGIPQTSAFSDVKVTDLQVHIDAILTPSYSVPKDSRVIRPLMVQLARYIRDLEAKVKELQVQLAAEEIVSCMDAPMSELSLSDTKKRHSGVVDPNFITTAQKLKNQIDPTPSCHRPEFWTLPYWQYVPTPLLPPLIFPPPDLIESLVTLYLRTTNIMYPLIHGPSLRRDIANAVHYTSREFGSVLLGICAIAARELEDPRVGTGHRAGWEFYQQLRPVELVNYYSSGSLTVWDLQLIPLMLIYLYGQTMAQQCWFLLGLGIRMAHEMGAHLKRRSSAPWTTADESLKRVWWVLVTIDCYAAVMFGRVRTTNPDVYDAEYPLEVDDEYWPGEPLANPAQPWAQIPGIPAQVTGWVHFIKLVEIFSFAQTTIYSIRRSELWDAISTAPWGHNVAVELDSTLNKWFDNIPLHLRWDPQQPSQASATLYTMYYWVQIHIHRPFIRSPANDVESISISSQAVCTNAARSCAHALQACHNKDSWLYTSSMLGGQLLHAAIVLLLNLQRQCDEQDREFGAERDLEDVRKLLEILRQHEGKLQVAGRYYDLIQDVFVLLKTPRTAASRKRKEHDEESTLQMTVQPFDHNFAVDFNFAQWEDWGFLPWNELGSFLEGIDELDLERPQ